MQEMDELFNGVVDLLMKAYPSEGGAGIVGMGNMVGGGGGSGGGSTSVVDTMLTSSQLIRLRLKAPGLLLMPSEGRVKREERLLPPQEPAECSAKRAKLDYRTPPIVVETAKVTPPANVVVALPPAVPTAAEQLVVEADLSPLEEYRRRPQFRRCGECTGVFLTNGLLETHLRSEHPGVKMWKCMAHTTCPLVFTDMRIMKAHVYEMHIKECPLCKCPFEESSLARHIITTHAALTTCPFCSVQYLDPHDLMCHVKAHHEIGNVLRVRCNSVPATAAAVVRKEKQGPSLRIRTNTESTVSVKSETTSP